MSKQAFSAWSRGENVCEIPGTPYQLGLLQIRYYVPRIIGRGYSETKVVGKEGWLPNFSSRRRA
jgi:hypothetical protein